MHFDLTDEQRDIQKLARDFSRDEIARAQVEMDETHDFPYETWRRWSELGMAGILIPEEFGGSGLDPLTYIVALEEVATVSNTFALIWQVHVLVSEMYRKFGNTQQKKTWLPIFASGSKLAAIALTEPGAGSDVAGMKTRAARDGQQWVLNGNKIFISNAGTKISDGLVVMAVTGQKPDGRAEISSFIVPAGSEGFKLGQSFKKMAWHGMDNRELVFEDCRIAETNLLGEQGHGMRQALGGLNLGRIAFGAISTGLTRACLEESMSYAQQRRAFGSTISKFQLVQSKIAQMATNMEAGRRLTHYAAWLYTTGQDCQMAAAQAKLFGTNGSTQAALDCFDIHGGYGFMEEFKANRYYREAKILEIGEGANAIQELLVARHLGL